MKYNINGFLIVEGLADKAFLSSFLNCEIITTGGFSIPRSTIEYILQLSSMYYPIIMCDNDEAGKMIKNRLLDYISNAYVVNVPFKNRKKYYKKGIAETSKEEILKCLQKFIIEEEISFGKLTMYNLLKYNLNDAKRRRFLQNYFKIGDCNLKATLSRLNYLNIDIKTIEDALNKYDNRY